MSFSADQYQPIIYFARRGDGWSIDKVPKAALSDGALLNFCRQPTSNPLAAVESRAWREFCLSASASSRRTALGNVDHNVHLEARAEYDRLLIGTFHHTAACSMGPGRGGSLPGMGDREVAVRRAEGLEIMRRSVSPKSHSASYPAAPVTQRPQIDEDSEYAEFRDHDGVAPEVTPVRYERSNRKSAMLNESNDEDSVNASIASRGVIRALDEAAEPQAQAFDSQAELHRLQQAVRLAAARQQKAVADAWAATQRPAQQETTVDNPIQQRRTGQPTTDSKLPPTEVPIQSPSAGSKTPGRKNAVKAPPKSQQRHVDAALSSPPPPEPPITLNEDDEDYAISELFRQLNSCRGQLSPEQASRLDDLSHCASVLHHDVDDLHTAIVAVLLEAVAMRRARGHILDWCEAARLKRGRSVPVAALTLKELLIPPKTNSS